MNWEDSARRRFQRSLGNTDNSATLRRLLQLETFKIQASPSRHSDTRASVVYHCVITTYRTTKCIDAQCSQSIHVTNSYNYVLQRRCRASRVVCMSHFVYLTATQQHSNIDARFEWPRDHKRARHITTAQRMYTRLSFHCINGKVNARRPPHSLHAIYIYIYIYIYIWILPMTSHRPTSLEIWVWHTAFGKMFPLPIALGHNLQVGLFRTKSSAVAERPRDASCHWTFFSTHSRSF